jgi:hypothetical protein
MDFDLLDIEIELMLDELDGEDEVFGGWTGTLKGGADILLSKSDRFSDALAHDLERARLKLEDVFLPSGPNRERAPENRTAVSSRWDIEFDDGPEPRLPHCYGALGPIGSKKLIEDTWEVAITADSGSASIRNVETGRMFIIHAGDRLGHAEVSDITAGGVEIAADDGSLYVVGAGARAGRAYRPERMRASDTYPESDWIKPPDVDDWQWKEALGKSHTVCHILSTPGGLPWMSDIKAARGEMQCGPGAVKASYDKAVAMARCIQPDGSVDFSEELADANLALSRLIDEVLPMEPPPGQSIFQGVGPIGSKKLIEGTWEIAACSDTGDALLRNVETGDMFSVHAGDRLGHAEVSDVTAHGVEIAADDGSLYMVGVGATHGRPSQSTNPADVCPESGWKKPDDVSDDDWEYALYLHRGRCQLYDEDMAETYGDIGPPRSVVLWMANVQRDRQYMICGEGAVCAEYDVVVSQARNRGNFDLRRDSPIHSAARTRDSIVTKAHPMVDPVSGRASSFGSTAAGSILDHRYGWAEGAKLPPRASPVVNKNPVSDNALGAVKAAAFLATGGGGGLYLP